MICSLISCKTTEEQLSVPIKYSNSSLLLSDIVENYDIIQFESTVNSTIGNIKKIAFLKDRLFILDKKNNCVLSFDNNGRFLNSSKSLIGNAKGEYISIEDIAVDNETSTLYMFCDRPNKIIILNKNLEFIKEKNLNVFPIEIVISGQYLYCYCYEHDNIKKRSLVRLDKNLTNDNIDILYNTSETIPGIDSFGASLSGNNGNEVTFCAPFSNSFIHNKNKILMTHYLDFGDKWYSYEDSKDLQPKEFLKNNENTIWAIKNICSNNNRIFFTTNQSIVFDYDTEKMICTGYKGIENDILPLNSPFIVPKQGMDGYIAISISVSSILQLKENKDLIIPNFENKYKCKLDKRIESIIDTYTETSNPIIIMYKLN